ncbi:MAG: hypothetical protein ACLPSF_13355 [Methylocella sp.]
MNESLLRRVRALMERIKALYCVFGRRLNAQAITSEEAGSDREPQWRERARSIWP